MAEPKDVVKKEEPQTEFEVKNGFKTSKKEYKKGDTITQTNPDAIAFLKSKNYI